MAFNKKSQKWLTIVLTVVFLLIAALVIFILSMSRQCGGSREIRQAQVEMPTTEATTTTTTTTTSPATTTTVTTTTTEAAIDYRMKLDRSYVAQYKAVNSDVVGWLYVDGTVIDYPIIQCDNNDEYIHQDWQGNYSYSGCIYEDFRGNLDKTNLTLLYGHNMADGSMFSAIRSYLDETWGKNHRYIEVASEKKRYLYEVFSVNVLYGEEGASFCYWMPTQPTTLELSKTEFKKYIDNIKSTSNVWYSGKNLPEYGDRIIALQTCNSGSDDGMRCVVYAKCLGEK
ncbi:MAG: class B sortase [Ruminococcus sp.]